MLNNVRILALDQRLGAAKPETDKSGKKVEATPVAQTATLEVSPAEAEMITLAGDLGSLSLALNSVRDGGDDALEPTEAMSTAGSGPKFDLAAKSLPPRRLTRESDVTSTNKIQVVRGVQIQSSPAPAAANAPASE